MADDVGSLLLRAGLVDPEQLDRARRAVQESGGTVPEELVRRGHVGDEDLTSFYRSRLLIPRVNPSELTRLSSGLLERVPADMATEFRSIPVALDADGNLTLIMSDPSDTKAAEEISFFTGSYVMRAVATQAQIAWCLAHYYKQETSLYRALVAEGVWPDTEKSAANSGLDSKGAPITSDPSNETAPMKTQPKPIKVKRKNPKAKKSGDGADEDEEKTTGPLKTRKAERPANQHPSPPELFARAGEIKSTPKPEPKMDAAPGVQICLDEEEAAVVRAVQRGNDTAPILLSTVKAKVDYEQSGPIILDDRSRKRRVSRQTSLGLGSVGSEKATNSPIQRALAEHAESGPMTISAGLPEDSGKAKGPSPEAVAASAGADPAPSVDDEVAARTVDLVGGEWGAPGTTIPPAYIGARPQEYDDVNDSIPVAIDDSDEVTTQINTGNASIPMRVDAISDATTRSEVPPTVKQNNLAESASKLLIALRAIDGSQDKRGILEPILSFLDVAFERTGFLALRQDDLTTWLLHGCTDDATSTVNTENDSTFRDVVRTRLPYNGPIEDAITKRFARDLDMPDAMDLLALPIAVRDRIVGVLFGLGSYDAIFEEHLTVLSQAAAESFERLLLARK